jgi:hypothetical protein
MEGGLVMVIKSPLKSSLGITKNEKQRTQIIALINGPDNLTDVHIGEIVGCSTKSVQRTRNKIKPALSEIKDKVEAYRRLISEELPLKYRVRRLRQLAEQDSQLMVALKALERADTLDGLERPPPEREDTKRVPLFNFPPGTHVDIEVRSPSPDPPPAIDIEGSVLNETEVDDR